MISMQEARVYSLAQQLTLNDENIAFQEILLAQGVMLALLSFFLFLSH